MALDIKGCVVRVISDINSQGWSGLIGNAGQWLWSQTGVV